ncbi:hypothetical protein ABO04_08880 [Nitrosomonas sp. HPC101]|nr:hypothetical protein [Nitrosomonas sp. HPC101]
MPTSGGGFEQAYNAQAIVDTDNMLIIAPTIKQACNDREQVKPMLDRLTKLPATLRKIEHLLTDNGFAGHKLYVLRKQTVEPMFGTIKSAMGLRQFSPRGLDKVKGEWTSVCLA